MTNPQFAGHPFGTTVTAETLRNTFAPLSQWEDNGKMHFFGDSEGRIVRGLLAVLLTAVEGKTVAELQAQSPLALFDELGLRAQLSASRSQGLNALSEAIIAATKQV